MVAILADALVRSAALAAIALVAVLAARKRSAAFRHAIWTAALCGMLLMPAATVVAPALPIRVLAPARVIALPAVSGAGAPEAPRASRVPVKPRVRFDWREAAAIAYAAVAAALLLRLAAAWIALARLLRRSAAAEPGIFESGEIAVPMTVGSRILLPSGWRDWDAAALAAALAHERAHVRRRDWLIGLLAAVNRSVFWLNPLAWWMERRLAALAEEACDDAALLATDDRDAYARVLLDMARRANDGRIFATAPAMASHVSHRIGRILDGGLRLSAGLSRASWILLLAAGLPVLYGAAAARLAPVQEAVTPPASAPIGMNETIELIAQGLRLTPEQAEALERRIESDPEDLDARSKLISHYYQNANHGPWIKHVLWMTEHHPGARVHNAYQLTVIPPTAGDEYQRARDLWLRAAEQHWDDARMLQTAADHVGNGDFEAARRLYNRARELAPADRGLTYALANLYAIQARKDPNGVQAGLEQSRDAELIGIAAKVLTSNPVVEPELNELGQRLLKTAMALDPDNPMWTSPPPGTQRIRVGARVQERKLTKRVEPEYPALARQARIQGTVQFVATIGTDGSISALKLISGHPLLAPAAEQAVRQWRYQPTLLNGSPVEVLTQIDVPFSLDGRPSGGVVGGIVSGVPGGVASGAPGGIVGGVPGGVESGVPGGVPAGTPGGIVGAVPSSPPPGVERIRVGTNVQAAKLLKHPDPVYPPLAKQARLQGTVRFGVVIGIDGRVRSIQLDSGHPLLTPAAQEAVRQYEYSPTLVNGSPVEVSTEVEVKFALTQ